MKNHVTISELQLPVYKLNKNNNRAFKNQSRINELNQYKKTIKENVVTILEYPFFKREWQYFDYASKKMH